MIDKGIVHTPPAPARIWVLLASEVSKAVIFRRGPSRWTRLYLWNTKTDEITPGSWFAGRLYEFNSDLSPNGEHLVYSAHNESKRRQKEAKISLGVDHFYSWTALCRPPWVKAIGLWDANDGWSGAFIGNETLLFSSMQPNLKAIIEPVDFTIQVAAGARFPPIYLISMQRTGWRHTDPLRANVAALWNFPATLKKRALAVRFSMSRQGKLIKEYDWHGPLPTPELATVSWADLDQQGRLVYARSGRLYALVEDREVELADLNLDQPPGRPEAKTTD